MKPQSTGEIVVHNLNEQSEEYLIEFLDTQVVSHVKPSVVLRSCLFV
jgi:hypothetical protein